MEKMMHRKSLIAVIIISLTLLITLFIVFIKYSLEKIKVPVLPWLLHNLPENDYVSLINLAEFEFLLNQPSCENENFIIFVHSAPDNWNKRMVIRQTWGSLYEVRVNFILGAATTANQQQSIMDENEVHGDIIQGNFIDSYKNMTYKYAMGLKWFSYYCPKAKYLIKTNDDTFLNTPNLMKTIYNGGFRRKKLLLCKVVKNYKLLREIQSIWYERPNEYNNHHIATYCSGFTIMFSADTVFRLYREVQRTPYFFFDNLHITGLLPKRCHLKLTNFNSFYLSPRKRRYLLRRRSYIKRSKFIFGEPNLSERRIRRLWKFVLKRIVDE